MSITITTYPAFSEEEDFLTQESESDSDSESLDESEDEKYPCTVRIYKIYQNDNPSMLYVGSTIDSLAQRLNNHKQASVNRRTKKNKFYTHVNSLPHKWDQMTMVLVHEIQNCEDKITRSRFERTWLKHLKANLNTQTPGALIDLCDGDTLLYDAKKYREDSVRREALLAHSRMNVRIKIVCDCGSTTSKSNRVHHLRTSRHISYANAHNIELLPPPVKRARYDF